MSTLPSHFLNLACPELSVVERADILNHGRMFGGRSELDLVSIAAHRPDVEVRLVEYAHKAASFWDSYVQTGVGGDCLVTERTLETYAKVDNKSAKIYLKEQISALEELNVFGKDIALLLSGKFDPADIPTFSIPVVVDGSLLYARVEVPGKHAWSEALGGTTGRGEIGRSFELKISYAKSHDRKNQRLLEVRVKVKEIWPS